MKLSTSITGSKKDDGPFALMSPDKWSKVIDTNLTGALNCSRSVIRPMLSKRKGAIVNKSSVAGIAASPGQVNIHLLKEAYLITVKVPVSTIGRPSTIISIR